jgi:hypothetical protein
MLIGNERVFKKEEEEEEEEEEKKRKKIKHSNPFPLTPKNSH